jgi:hypothetical protein
MCKPLFSFSIVEIKAILRSGRIADGNKNITFLFLNCKELSGKTQIFHFYLFRKSLLCYDKVENGRFVDKNEGRIDDLY